jgi:alpha-tubulin suppressor-like RCC1 family protein
VGTRAIAEAERIGRLWRTSALAGVIALAFAVSTTTCSSASSQRSPANEGSDAGSDGDASDGWTPDAAADADRTSEAASGMDAGDELVGVADGSGDAFDEAGPVDGGSVDGDANARCLGPDAGCDQVARIAAGTDHTCAVLTSGQLWCWGLNSNGQLGSGTIGGAQYTPIEVVGLTGVQAVAASMHTCALLGSGDVSCWGSNGDGQVGDGSTTDRATPQTVPGLHGVLEVAVGLRHTCALLGDGSVSCWGANDYGQLGDKSTALWRTKPGPVPNLASVAHITASNGSTCGLLTTGEVDCWGDDFMGQLGDGTTSNQPAPVMVQRLGAAQQVAMGGPDACAISTNLVYCWGDDSLGELGDNLNTTSLYPKLVALSGSPQQIAAGKDHNCVVTTVGDVACWGDDGNGELGDGTLNSRGSPPSTPNVGGAVASLSAGTDSTCAVLVGGDVRCWGINTYGQLGDGTNIDRYIPTRLAW